MIWAEKIGLKSVATHFIVTPEYEVIVICENGGIDAYQLKTCRIKVLYCGQDVTDKFLVPDLHVGKKVTASDFMNVIVSIYKIVTVI